MPSRPQDGEQPLPLEGVVVVDCTHVLAGPYCTSVLADLGAEVIKIESPAGGDECRRIGKPLAENYSSDFVMVNRGKKSVTLNLKTTRGREIFWKLLDGADVLVENFRPGTMTRLGCGYDKVSADFPGLIYCSISGFGQYGPDADKPCFDLVAQAMSGLMSITGQPGGPVTKTGVPVGDLSAGMYAATAIVAALLYKSRSGRGQFIDIALMDTSISFMPWESAELWYEGRVPEPVGAGHRNRAPYQPFRTADGHVIIAAGNESTWKQLCAALGREDLLVDPRFAQIGARLENLAELVSEMESVTTTMPTDHWVDLLNEIGCPGGPVRNLQQVFSDPHVLSRGMMLTHDDPDLGEMRSIGSPIKMSVTPPRVRSIAPRLGEHTSEVLASLGIDGKELDLLEADGVVSVAAGRSGVA